VQLNPAQHENKRSSFGALGGSTRGGFNVKTDEPPRAGLTELAGRIWPAGLTLPTPVLICLLLASMRALSRAHSVSVDALMTRYSTLSEALNRRCHKISC